MSIGTNRLIFSPNIRELEFIQAAKPAKVEQIQMNTNKQYSFLIVFL